MSAMGARGGWTAVLALAAALATGSAVAQEYGEAPAGEGGEVVLNEEGGWEVAEGGPVEETPPEEPGEDIVWVGVDDPDSVDGWELEEGGEVVADSDEGPGACDACGSEDGVIMGEVLAEGGSAEGSGSPAGPVLARGTRIQSGGHLSGGSCSGDELRGAVICAWLASR